MTQRREPTARLTVFTCPELVTDLKSTACVVSGGMQYGRAEGGGRSGCQGTDRNVRSCEPTARGRAVIARTSANLSALGVLSPRARSRALMAILCDALCDLWSAKGFRRARMAVSQWPKTASCYCRASTWRPTMTAVRVWWKRGKTVSSECFAPAHTAVMMAGRPVVVPPTKVVTDLMTTVFLVSGGRVDGWAEGGGSSGGPGSSPHRPTFAPMPFACACQPDRRRERPRAPHPMHPPKDDHVSCAVRRTFTHCAQAGQQNTKCISAPGG